MTPEEELLRQQANQARIKPIVSNAEKANALRSGAAPTSVPVRAGFSADANALRSGAPAVSAPIRTAVPPASDLRAAQATASVPQRVAPTVNIPVAAETVRIPASGAPSVSAPAPAAGFQPSNPVQYPNQAPAMRAGAGNVSPPARVAVPASEPFALKQPAWYNRPINTKPATDAIGKAAPKVGSAAVNTAKGVGRVAGKTLSATAKYAGRLAVPVGAAIEAADTYNDVSTEGMTGIDKTARVAEGVGRFGMATGLGVKGAAAGGAIAGPVGAVVGGIGGGLAGYFAPDAANAAVNSVKEYFGGDASELASQKAKGLQAASMKALTPAAAPTPQSKPAQQAAQPQAAAFTPNNSAGAGRGFSQAPQQVAQAAPQQQRSTAPAAGFQSRTRPAQAAPAAPAAAAQQVAPPADPLLDNVAFISQGSAGTGFSVGESGMTFTSPEDRANGGFTATMNDGTVVTGQKAAEIMAAMNRRDAAGQQDNSGAVQVIRGMNSTYATPQMGYANEISADAFNTLSKTPGGFDAQIAAQAQGMVDAANPSDAKTRGALEQQALQNAGSATNASISAGPGYARVGEDKRQFGITQDNLLKGIGPKPVQDEYISVDGGQSIQNIGGFPTAVKNPALIVNKRTGEPRQIAPQADIAQAKAPSNWQIQKLTENPTLAAQFDEQFGPGAAAKILKAK